MDFRAVLQKPSFGGKGEGWWKNEGNVNDIFGSIYSMAFAKFDAQHNFQGNFRVHLISGLLNLGPQSIFQFDAIYIFHISSHANHLLINL